MADLSLVADSVRDNPTPFDRALERYRFAMAQAHQSHIGQDMDDLLTDAIIGAENAVMAEPANTVEELRAKLDIIFLDIDSTPPDRHVFAIFADLIRLTGNTPSRLFDPARWLAWFERCGGGWVVRDDKAWLMWPEEEGVFESCFAELKMRGGKQAVMDLIRARHEAQEA